MFAPLRTFFSPRSVAVIGVGRTQGVGAAIFRNLIASFAGHVFPVNPRARTIGAHQCYAAATEIPQPVDLAIIAVPAAQVEQAVDDCIRKGVPSILMITAGYGETGDAGRLQQAALRDKVRAAGIRMIGPNCLGTVNTDPSVRLNASFAAGFPPEGPVAFASQSGALGLAMLEAASQLNLGISNFASIGNSADVSAADLLELWDTDERARVILLYLEAIAEPRRFLEVARRVARRKPIVALKAGRSTSGARAASSHTGALAAGDALVDALLLEAGVIRAATLEELFEVGALLARQPLPSGRRVAILTNAGGPGILAADACDVAGLEIAALSSGTTETLRSFLPATANLTDPVDMIATASPEDYRRAIPTLLADPGVDAVVAMFIPLSVTSTADVARAITDTSRGSPKPVLATFFGAPDASSILAPVPAYTFPESPIRALGRVATYASWRSAPVEVAPAFDDFDVGEVRRLVDAARTAGGGWLTPDAVPALLAATGITAVSTEIVADEEAARTAAARLGYPVVLKGMGPRLLHKTESHAVITRLADEPSMLRAFHALAGRADVEHVVIQPMIDGGAEMFVGATFDTAFGHLIVCGGGGTTVELLRDTAHRLAPLSEAGVCAMLDQVRSVRLLRGFRGGAVLDEPAFRQVILRVSALVEAAPEIRELDLNPVVVTRSGACVVDARLRIAAPDPERQPACV